MQTASKILVGTSGWSHEDWDGVFYPLGMDRRREHPLTYLAQYFDMVEINTSFNEYIKPELAKVWAKRVESVNPKFKFTAKLFNSFSHSSQDRRGPTSAASINPSREDEVRVREGLDSLAATGRLGAVLVQFPLSYRNTPLNREYLGILAHRFREFRLAVELRDESWNSPETVRYLSEMQMAFCNVDTLLVQESFEGTEYLTSPVGYVRLNGRRAGASYLYNSTELKVWTGKIQAMANDAEAVYVVTNNIIGAKAVVNGLQLKQMLTGNSVEAPEVLLRQYPNLRQIA
jgi:uncharacterized protein YecE (DUF72 family)